MNSELQEWIEGMIGLLGSKLISSLMLTHLSQINAWLCRANTNTSTKPSEVVICPGLQRTHMDKISLLSCRDELEGEASQYSRGPWWLRESECQRKFWRKSGLDKCVVGSNPVGFKSRWIVHLDCILDLNKNQSLLCQSVGASDYVCCRHPAWPLRKWQVTDDKFVVPQVLSI